MPNDTNIRKVVLFFSRAIRRKGILVTVGALAVLVIAWLILALAGDRFISEVTQEIPIVVATSAPALLSSPAPAFALPDKDGKIVRLIDFRGTPLLIVFWTSWNGASLDELSILDKKGAIPPGMRVVAIASQEDPSVVSNLFLRSGYSVPTLVDVDGAVTALYGANSLPALYYIDAKGIMRLVTYGPVSSDDVARSAETILGL